MQNEQRKFKSPCFMQTVPTLTRPSFPGVCSLSLLHFPPTSHVLRLPDTLSGYLSPPHVKPLQNHTYVKAQT